MLSFLSATLQPLDFLRRKPRQFGNQTGLKAFRFHGSCNICLSFGSAFGLGGIDNVVIVPFGNHIVFVSEFLLRSEFRNLASLKQSLERPDPQLLRQPVQRPDMLQRIAPLVHQTHAVVQFLLEAVQFNKVKNLLKLGEHGG